MFHRSSLIKTELPMTGKNRFPRTSPGYSVCDRNKTAPVAVFLWGLCLLLSQTAYAKDKALENETSSCQHPFLKKITTVARDAKSGLIQSVKSLEKTRTAVAGYLPAGYSPGTVLDRNDSQSIHQALSVIQGDGAAIININPFTLKIAEKLRKAIRASFFLSDQFIFRQASYEEDWGEFINGWLLPKTRIISPEEIDQFRKELEKFLSEIKQTILEVDGQIVELETLAIRAGGIAYITPAHTHAGETDSYIVATIAPVGLSTYYYINNNRWRAALKKVISPSEHTVVLSNPDRVKTLSENRKLVLHGTPFRLRKRLLILASFKKSRLD